MKEFFTTSRSWLLIIILGALLFLVGISSDISISNFTIKIPDNYGRIILDVIGVILILFGIILGWRELQIEEIQEKRDLKKGVLVSPESGIKEAINYLSNHHEASSLIIWGFSLNWTKNISSYLSGFSHQKLDVKIFVPNQKIIGKYFIIEDGDEHKSVLKLRLSEWNKLSNQNSVKSVTIYSHNLIPNDLGLIIDDKFAIVGTYDWEQKDRVERKNRTEQKISTLSHKRVPQSSRQYLKLLDNSEVGKVLIKVYSYRFLCRQFDQIEKG